jgi:uncharacterized membrane protein
MEWLSIDRWIHYLAGVTWIGLLYYFNFVQVPALAAAAADKGGPGPAAIGKYIAPRALLWFRWAAVATWVSGAVYLGANFPGAFMLGMRAEDPGSAQYLATIGMGAWLGTIMIFNVWFLIWPNQKKSWGWSRPPMRRRPGPGAWRSSPRAPTPCYRSRCCCSWGRPATVCRFDDANGSGVVADP